MARYDAVVFDWMQTLAHYPSPAEHVERALARLERPTGADSVSSIVAAMNEAKKRPDVQAAEAVEDTSAAAHHHSEHLLYRSAGLDDELADSLYVLLGTPDFHPPYPDARSVLEQLARTGLGIGVVSDIHVDLRTHAESFGFEPFVDAWALSFELGIQKPNPAIFRHALAQLGTTPERTLMVGDRPSRDGAAAEIGMPCLILPAIAAVAERGLDAVVALATT